MHSQVTEWWRSLGRPPDPLTAPQRWSVAAAAVVAAVSRFFALARTPWDWDEVLFMQALERFDVAAHHPHPPGFPLYILAARIVRAFGLSDFHALQIVSLLAAVAIVPAMFFLCRELRLRFSTSLAASILLVFFPNVWFYGGAAFSDVPAMVLIAVSVALLLAGCRSSPVYFAGAALLGLSAGFRPQALLIGCAPFLIASAFQVRRGRGRVFAAAGVIAVIPAAAYGAAAWLTGWSAYRRTLVAHSDYIARVDSFRSPLRPPLWRVFDDFFVMPYHAPAINAAVALLVLISAVVTLVRIRPALLAAMAAFGPFCLFTWLMLDRWSASRFSIAYAPLLAILAADGLCLMLRRPSLELAAAAAIAAGMIVWTWPALREVRNVSPPLAAVDWIRAHADPRSAAIDVDGTMLPFAERFLAGYRLEVATPARPALFLHEGIRRSPDGKTFARPHGRLWDVARRRYFEVSVEPLR